MSSRHPDRAPYPLDHAAARALLAGRLPAERHRRLVPAGEGDFCLAFREGTRIVRVARHARAAAALRREACVLSRIADRLPLPVPRPAHHEADGGPAYSVHEAVVGEALTRERWLGLPAAERDRIAAELAAFLGALHGLPAEAGLRCGLPSLDRAGLARRLRDGVPGTIDPMLGPEDGRRLDDFLARCSGAEPGAGRAAALLHGDVAPGHLLFDPAAGRLTGIIDFGDLALGDPARDFVYVYEDFGEELLAAVLARYPGERATSLLPRIRDWYLLEAVSWTVEASLSGREAETREGIGEIARELGRG